MSKGGRYLEKNRAQRVREEYPVAYEREYPAEAYAEETMEESVPVIETKKKSGSWKNLALIIMTSLLVIIFGIVIAAFLYIKSIFGEIPRFGAITGERSGAALCVEMPCDPAEEVFL